jgi:hypothetical protein
MWFGLKVGYMPWYAQMFCMQLLLYVRKKGVINWQSDWFLGHPILGEPMSGFTNTNWVPESAPVVHTVLVLEGSSRLV